jgi:aldehyde:ferredoxin oxidoreductase
MQTLRQLFNIKHGVDPGSFKITDRMAGNPPLEEGPLAGISVDIEKMMQNYWKVFEWDPATGIPTDESLEKLHLDNL